MTYQSFDGSKNKLEKEWNDSLNNTTIRENQQDFNVKITQKNFLKKQNIVTIADSVSSSPLSGSISIDIPKAFVTYIKPYAVFYYPYDAMEINGEEASSLEPLLPESTSQDASDINYPTVLADTFAFRYFLQEKTESKYVFYFYLNKNINDNPVVRNTLQADIKILMINPMNYKNKQKN